MKHIGKKILGFMTCVALTANAVSMNVLATSYNQNIMLEKTKANEELSFSDIQKDPFGDADAKVPPVGSEFHFLQEWKAEELFGNNIVITPEDTCYMLSKANGRGKYRIHVKGKDLSIPLYTKFYKDTEYKVDIEKSIIIGDINDDKRVDVFDFIFLKKMLIHEYTKEIDEKTFLRADINEDGIISSISDVVILRKLLLNEG